MLYLTQNKGEQIPKTLKTLTKGENEYDEQDLQPLKHNEKGMDTF